MSIELFTKYKNQFLNIVEEYFQNLKNVKSSPERSYVFDINFWTREIKGWWKWTNFYVWLSSIAIQQFTEGISMGMAALSFVAGLGTVIPGYGLALGIYMVANMAIWRHIDQGKGVISRYLFLVIPTGYWAET